MGIHVLMHRSQLRVILAHMHHAPPTARSVLNVSHVHLARCSLLQQHRVHRVKCARLARIARRIFCHRRVKKEQPLSVPLTTRVLMWDV